MYTATASSTTPTSIPPLSKFIQYDTHRFSIAAALLQLLLILAFAFTAEYANTVQSDTMSSGSVGLGGGHDGKSGKSGQGGMDFYYPLYQDVHVMIMIGFGCLMAFMESFTWGGIGLTFLTAALTIQCALLTNGFWHNVHLDHWSPIAFDIQSLIRADFACGAVLISYGAVLGKVTPLQLLVMAVVECVVFGGNEYVGAYVFGAVDMGGSIFVHTFGAYFGLAVSWALANLGEHHRVPSSSSSSSSSTSPATTSALALSTSAYTGPVSTKTTDTFAMIGALFLWCFWPSFNGALATGAQQHRVVVNTVLALSGSCVSTFMASSVFRRERRFSMVDVQNAALAGGVAVGSSSDLVIQPWGAVLVGCTAGVVSVAGFTWLTGWMERRMGVPDTCGVHNLHGLPGILGAIGGAVSAALAGTEAYGESITTIFPARANTCDSTYCGLSAGGQASYQMAALAVTLGIAVCGGVLTGMMMGEVSARAGRVRDEDVFVVEEEE